MNAVPDTHPNAGSSRRRRRRLLCLYICSITSLVMVVDAFHQPHSAGHVVRRSLWGTAPTSSSSSSASSSSPFLTHPPSRIVCHASRDSNKQATPYRSSPLKVRRRVRAVLERARSRTGIDNTSSSPSNDVAEYVVPVPKNGVAQPRRNGRVKDSLAITEGMSIEYPVPTNNAAPTSAKNGAVKPSGAARTVVEKANGVVQDKNKSTDKKSLNGMRQPDTNIPDTPAAVASTSTNVTAPATTTTSISTETPSSDSLDAIKADVPSAVQFCEPLPFTLPKLSKEQIRLLQRGERVQEQSRMGREGSGFVVLDVKAPPYVVWECLLDFESYPETIPTVRDMQLFTNEKLNTGYVNEKPVLPGTGRETRHYGTPSVTRAAFVLSKFRLNIAAIHKYTPHPDGDYMEFTLDPACTNMVLKGAKGTWYTEEAPEGREEYTRVYLLCEVKISRALPSFIVDYAADRAMPRATTWLRPQVEAAADLWLRPRP